MLSQLPYCSPVRVSHLHWQQSCRRDSTVMVGQNSTDRWFMLANVRGTGAVLCAPS